MDPTEVRVIEETDQFTHVSFKGRLDTAGIAHVESRFLAAAGARGKHTLVDLSGVSFLASLGIRMFVSAARLLARKGAKLILYAPAPLVRESMQRAAIDDMLTMCANAQEARAQLKP